MSQPRAASVSPEREYAPRRQSRDRRGRSRTPRSLSAGSDEPHHLPYQPPVNRDDQRRSKKKKGALPVVDEGEDTTRAFTNTPRDTANKLAETAAKNKGDGGKEDSTLSLRLDLNLDVYVKLTAKVHGDITLTLL
jgi:hypothetical protein